MTLEEQISQHAKYWDCYNDEPLKYDHSGKLLKIANEFAIGFTEWVLKNYDGVKSTKELLEIYKKEKGL